MRSDKITRGVIKLDRREFAKIVFQAMPKNTKMRTIPDYLVTMFENYTKMLKWMSHVKDYKLFVKEK